MYTICRKKKTKPDEKSISLDKPLILYVLALYIPSSFNTIFRSL